MENARGPGVRRGSARLANSHSSLRVSRGSMISSTQKVSAVRNGERSALRRVSISASLALRSGAAHVPAGRLAIRYAWLSAWWGSLPLEGGIEAAYRADIDAAGDPKAKLAEIEARLNALRSPFRTAETFWVEEIIDPRETRRLLCEFADLAEPLRTPGTRAFAMRP